MTPTRRLLDLNLEGKLDELVTSSRNAGGSWDDIAFDIATRTGVRVSGESLRTWFADTTERAS